MSRYFALQRQRGRKMIHDLDSTIKNILLDKMPSNIDVKFDQPVKNWTQAGPILNLYLFDVRENNTLRAHQWQKANGSDANGNGRDHKRRTPFRFDCHYLLTAWAKNIANQHQLLSEAAAVLLQYPILPEAYLVGSLHPDRFEHPVEIPARVGSHDKLTNPAELWSALDNQIRPAVSYIVTIPIQPWAAQREEKQVTTKHLILQQRQRPETAVSHTEIAGEIKSNGELPPHLHVTLSNEKWRYQADVAEDGRYRINGIVPDSYTLTAWQQTDAQAARKLGERTIIVPPAIQILALADTFHLQIGQTVAHNNLHLTPRKAGFVGKAKLNGFAVSNIGSQLPRSGTYFFGREEGKVEVEAEIPTATTPGTSFKLSYKNPDKALGSYDLSISEP